MQQPAFDQQFWDARWEAVLRDHADQIAGRPPNGWLTSELAGMPPGTALDAGCGHGSESLWLAARGWRVTAVDFSQAALAHAAASAEPLGSDVAARIEWVQADLVDWAPEPDRFDLVVSLYVHIAGSATDAVRRLASGVAPGGTLFMVGHRPFDPETGEPTPAAGQTQVSVDDARRALDTEAWTFEIAEERRRPAAGSGVDAVIRCRRTT